MTEQVEVPRDVSTKKLTDDTLNPLRIIRGLICLVIFISTAFMFLVYFVPAVVVFLRLFSVHYSRKSVFYLFGLWLGLWPFFFEKVNKTKVVFSGETVPNGERVLLIANHRTEVDWMYPWDLALRKGCLGSIKYVLKSSLMKLPIFGWGFYILEFIPVERKWDVDEPVLRQMLSTFTDRQDPLWLTVFPEGTDFTEEKCTRSQKFASENGLPVLSNVLLPKTKGFHVCLEALRISLDAVYDLTIAYKRRCPSFLDNVFGTEPAEVHIHVRRIPLAKIPSSEKEANTWLMDTFEFKDKLLSDFSAYGHFPNEGTEEELSTLKCFINFALVTIITAIFTYLTFFSSIWFKLYVALVCIFLASATYFGIRPPSTLSLGKINSGLRKTV